MVKTKLHRSSGRPAFGTEERLEVHHQWEEGYGVRWNGGWDFKKARGAKAMRTELHCIDHVIEILVYRQCISLSA